MFVKYVKRTSSVALMSFFMALGALSLASCAGTESSGRPVIAVSIPPQESLLREIVGDSVDVVTLLRPDSNPETFEITVNDLKEIYGSDAYFRIGNLPFEASLTDKIAQSKPDLKFYDNSKGISLLYGTHGSCEHHHDHGHDHEHEAVDPHTWTSLPNMKIIASNMLEGVVEVDPDNEAYYRSNYGRLVARLDSLDNAIAASLEPMRGKSFLVWHPSLSYFARDYGLNQLTLGQENKEMSVRGLRDNMNRASESGVVAIFVQTNFDPSQVDNIARELNLKPIEINPLSADWESEFKIIADALADSSDAD